VGPTPLLEKMSNPPLEQKNFAVIFFFCAFTLEIS
jgi:hypothetical protein